MSSKPIRPSEVKEHFDNNFPSFIIDAINDVIKESYRPNSKKFDVKLSVVKNKIITAISNYNDEFNASYQFKDYFLDFENLYKKFGWKVSFDKATYGDSYESFYTFEVNE